MTFDMKAPLVAIKVHTGRFIRKMTFDMKAPPVAIKVHTGRFIRKMTFDMKAPPRGYQSTHRQIYKEDDI